MNVQDIINTVTEQRNAALNELALVKAQLIAAERLVGELQKQLKDVPTSPVPKE